MAAVSELPESTGPATVRVHGPGASATPRPAVPAAPGPQVANGGLGRLTSIQREEMRRRRRAVLRRRRIAVCAGIAALVLAVVEIVSAGGPHPASASRHGGQSGVAGAATPPPPTAARLVVGAPLTVTAPGAGPLIAWPATGQGAVGVGGMGVMASSPGERPAPIASMTKMMTALVVVQDHPLALGQAGPIVTMSAADYAAYLHDSQSDDSNVPVRRGERLSELQLLEGLLIPSGDNLARTLAVWDAGSVPAFVAKMNAEARALGLSHTHYADPAGLSPLSRSTAGDQVRVAEALMSSPALRYVVGLSHVAFPIAGTIWNFNPALGVDGIVGVKSGFTNLAQACLATAAYSVVAGRQVLVVAVSMHQPDGLYGAAQADEQLLAEAGKALHPVVALAAHRSVAPVEVPWANRVLEAVGPSAAVEVPGWSGLRLSEQVVAGPLLHAGVPAGAYAGRLLVSSPAGVLASVVLRLSGAVPQLPGSAVATPTTAVTPTTPRSAS